MRFVFINIHIYIWWILIQFLVPPKKKKLTGGFFSKLLASSCSQLLSYEPNTMMISQTQRD